jgi:alginate O-acetyltransferase complex protein AlgI
VILALSATRYLRADLRPLASLPPETLPLTLALLISGTVTLLLWRVGRLAYWPRALTLLILLIVLLFVVLKTEPLARWSSGLLRAQTGQDVSLAAPADLAWLGFSYIAFRLIHTLRERQIGSLTALTLREYVTYTLFFPALTAGPIDRAERFAGDYRALAERRILDPNRYAVGAGRIAVGLLKKFVIADSLALFALNDQSAAQATSTGGLWLLLYAYAFRLFFDFSGYTDIAIGLGMLFGVDLPENFDRPYSKNNLAAFWQSWHITLSNWARFYVFSPLSRFLMTRKNKPSPLLAVLIAQTATMLVIGLWHGVTLNFVIWGLWHGLGLFAHKLWSDRTRARYLRLKQQPQALQVWTLAGVLITFHFVVLSWVWFALSQPETAVTVFGRLWGVGW